MYQLLGFAFCSAALAAVGMYGVISMSIVRRTSAGQRWLRSQLYGIAPTDPLVLIGVSVAFGVVACMAVFLPAVRALRIDPARVLRV